MVGALSGYVGFCRQKEESEIEECAGASSGRTGPLKGRQGSWAKVVECITICAKRGVSEIEIVVCAKG